MAYDVSWNSVVLAMHMDDTGLSDVKGHTVTLNGSAARSATWSTFGGYSLSLPGSGSYVGVASSSDFAFGTGDFDVSFFVRLDASGTQYMMQSDAIGTSTSDKWWIGYVSGQLGIGQHSTANSVKYTCTMNTGTGYHVRICRVLGVTYVFLDGTLLGSASTFSATSFSQNGLSIGGISTPAYMTGYIDDLLITQGVGRSTSSFTVPTGAFAERLPAVSGIVQDENDNYISRLVRVFNRDTGALSGSAVSNATTGAYSISTTSDDEHFALVHDAVGNPDWNDVVLAMHMDDTSLTDQKGHVVTLNGSAARSATQSKFGGYSCSLPSSGSYLSIEAPGDTSFGSNDFTIRAFVYRTASGTTQMIVDARGSAGDLVNAYLFSVSSANKLNFRASTVASGGSGGGWTLDFSGTTSLSTGQWHLAEVTRSGSTFRLFLDGVVDATATNSLTIGSIGAYPLYVGAGATGAGTLGYYFTGYIDDLLAMNGKALHVADYTVDTSTFLDGLSGGTENALILDRLVPV